MYQFDHIVHFVEQPEQALEELQKEGLHVVAGGKHDMWGTHNTLCYFGLSYIEFIGIFDEALFTQAAKKQHTLHESYEKRHRRSGLTRIALRTTTIEQDAVKFKDAGFDVIGPETFSRVTPEGQEIKWQLLHIGEPNSKIEFPFLIQWEHSDEQRLEDLKQRGVIASHPAGELKLQAVSYLVDDFTPILKLSEICGIETTIVQNEELNAEVATVHIEGGNLEFYRPLGEGEVWNAMMDSGKGLYNAVLVGSTIEKVVYFEEGEYIFLENV